MNDSTVNFEVLSTTVEMIGPERAKELLAMDFQVQRQIRRNRVMLYAESMRRGEWSLGDGMIITATTPGGRTYLTAGYHRLNAVVVSGVRCAFTVQCRRFTSESAIKQDYALGDNGGLIVTKNDQTRVLGTGESLGLSTKVATTYISALGLIACGFSYNSNRTASIVRGLWLHESFPKWEAQVLAYNRTITTCPRHMIAQYRRVPVVAVMLTVLRFSTSKALPFLEAACADDGLRRDSPEWQLNRYITTKTCSSSRDYYPYCVGLSRIWNAYFEGRDSKHVKTTSVSGANIRLLGTPFDGGITDGIGVVGGKAQ